MNIKQKIVVWIAAALVVAMGLYPPWLISGTMDYMELDPVASRYQWIFRMPEPNPHLDKGVSAQKIAWKVRIDTTRLLIQWAMVGVVAGSLAATLKTK